MHRSVRLPNPLIPRVVNPVRGRSGLRLAAKLLVIERWIPKCAFNQPPKGDSTMKVREGICCVIIAACLIPMTVAAQAGRMAEEPKPIDQSKLTPLTPEQLKKLQDVRPDSIVSICKNQQVPSGWVIVSEGSNAFCPGNFPNTWNIKQPGATETICKVSPMPSGYVIQGEGSHAFCPGRFPNTWHIRRL